MNKGYQVQARRLFLMVIFGSLLTAILLADLRSQTAVKVADVATLTTKKAVDIGLTYNGDHIYFFGYLPDPCADIIVKLTSVENAPMAVTRKGKVAFFWMNVKQFEITGLPLLYEIHSTRPIDQIIDANLARELGLGYDVLKNRMQLKVVRGRATPDDRDVVFGGILRLKQEADLYSMDDQHIEIVAGKLFKHSFRFPPAAREGTYRAESYVVRDGRLIGKGMDEIVVKKMGVEAELTTLASQHPAAYGLAAVIVALGMGLLVGFVFRRGGGH